MNLKQLLTTCLIFISLSTAAQEPMQNVEGRVFQSLNGKWDMLIDPYSRGGADGSKLYQNRKPKNNSDFVEYSFDGAMRLNVPGDFNSQSPELKLYEGNVWYRKLISVSKTPHCRYFLYFAGVNYQASVWLNGTKLGDHEGGFTPFQFEASALLKEGENCLVVLANNERRADGIPALNFDWFNYGGITRDVYLIETKSNFIQDYQIELQKESTQLTGFVQLNKAEKGVEVKIQIPELKLSQRCYTDTTGRAVFTCKANPVRWNTENPKRYEIHFSTPQEIITEQIGFRTIEVKGEDVLLNGKPVFLKGVNFHEEIPQRMGRAFSDADAAMLLSEAKALGCNFIRLSHYPQNERIIRLAEQMGFLLWEEIPIWQGIDFSNDSLVKKAKTMLQEMILRDKNRAGIILWGIANETFPDRPMRTEVLIDLASYVRKLDPSRLVTAAFCNTDYDKKTHTFTLNDPLIPYLDVIGCNKYVGWYAPFETDPAKISWNVAKGKPLIMSEFGGEALFGQAGNKEVAHSWGELYLEKLYQDNLLMFEQISNLRGTAPWILFDFRSPNRLHPQHQEGWNRKGLVSDQGMRKKAWYVMRNWYNRSVK